MTTTSPYGAAFSPMVTYTANNTIVLYNTGSAPNFNFQQNSLWSYSGSTKNWTLQQVYTAMPKPLRRAPALGYDGTNCVVYGGLSDANYLSDVWNISSSYAFTEVDALQAPQPAAPFQRTGAYMAYVSGSSTLYMWGGSDINLTWTDLWYWTHAAQSWTQATTTVWPPARRGSAMTSDGTNLWVWGGRDARGQGGYRQDLWEWTSGGGWAQITTTNPPPGLADFAMAYDVTNSLWTIFGGQTQNGLANQTYTMNSSGVFTNRTPATVTPFNSPSGRIGASMAYDPVNAKMILFVGANSANHVFNDTWSWDNVAFAWTQL
jgi:hypothetical protein